MIIRESSRNMTRYVLGVSEIEGTLPGTDEDYVLVAKLVTGWKCYPLRKGTSLWPDYIMEKFDVNEVTAIDMIEVLIEQFPEYNWL